MEEENNYYVYVYYYKGDAIYVGKGKYDRYKVHLKRCLKSKPGTNPFYDKLSKIINGGENPIIKILYDNLSNDDALLLERKTELEIGTKKDKTGTLLNILECGLKNPILYGKLNPMYGISLYSKWSEKYGIEKADEMMTTYKSKMKISSSNKIHSKTTKYLMSESRKEWHLNKSEDVEIERVNKIKESWNDEKRRNFTSLKMSEFNKNNTGGNHPKSVKCEIEGIIYNSLKDVQLKYNFKNHNSVNYRLNSDKFPEWKSLK